MKEIRFYPKNESELESFILRNCNSETRNFFFSYHTELYFSFFWSDGVTTDELDQLANSPAYMALFENVYHSMYKSAERDILEDRRKINASIDDMVGTWGFTREELERLFKEDDDRTQCAIAGLPYSSEACYIW